MAFIKESLSSRREQEIHNPYQIKCNQEIKKVKKEFEEHLVKNIWICN